MSHRDTIGTAHLASTVDRDAFAAAVVGGRPFLAKAALECRIVTRHGLASRYRLLHPGVYIAADARPSTRDRIRAAGLWAPPDAAIAGWAAAKLHGERWYSDRHCSTVVDVFSTRSLRPTPGVRVHVTRRTVSSQDLRMFAGLTVTTAARAAVDVARWTRGRDLRVCAVDSVCNASKTTLPEVAAAANRMTGQHGIKSVLAMLPDCDPGADSPQESMLRLSIERSDLPKPVSQLAIHNEYGQKVATADLAYEREKVAIFYDGAGHGRSDQWRFDAEVNAELADLGWEVVRVVSGVAPAVVLHRIARALERGRRRHHL